MNAQRSYWLESVTTKANGQPKHVIRDHMEAKRFGLEDVWLGLEVVLDRSTDIGHFIYVRFDEVEP